MNGYKAIFFDFGGTLAFDYPPIPEGLACICRNLGLEITADEVERARRAVHQSGLRTKSYPTPARMEDYFLRFYRALLLELDFGGDVEEAAKKIRREWRYYSGLYLFPEVQQVLCSLQDRNYTIGIISNISCRLPALLKKLGIAPYFDFAIASDVFGFSKPDQRIFEEALRRADVSASQAIHVGDSYQADILGAKNAGITSVLIDRENQHPETDCQRINNLLLLLKILEKA